MVRFLVFLRGIAGFFSPQPHLLHSLKLLFLNAPYGSRRFHEIVMCTVRVLATTAAFKKPIASGSRSTQLRMCVLTTTSFSDWRCHRYTTGLPLSQATYAIPAPQDSFESSVVLRNVSTTGACAGSFPRAGHTFIVLAPLQIFTVACV